MSTSLSSRRSALTVARSPQRAFFLALASIMAVGVALSSATAHGQDIYVTIYEGEMIGEYTTSGGTMHASLVSGLSYPWGIAVSGSDLFVTNTANGTIGEYTTSGGTVNPSLVTGLNYPFGIAVSGSDLFVANAANGTIGEYTTSGGTVIGKVGRMCRRWPWLIVAVVPNAGSSLRQ